MPLYEYQCAKCGERFEILQKISDPLYTHCPKCGGEMRKLISQSAIQFKGSGFYKNDYARSDAKAESKSDAKTESKTESKSDGKSSSTEKAS